MAQEENKKKKKEKEDDKTEETQPVEDVDKEDEVGVTEEVKEDVDAVEDQPEADSEADAEEIIQDANPNEEEVVEENISEEVEGVVEEKGEKKIPDFRVGDTVRVYYKIIEGDKIRTQPFQGIVIAKKGAQNSKTFTVRKIGADDIGVERIFPLFSPNIESIKLIKKGKVRRAKLYYLRDRIGRKATRIKERITN